MVSASTNDTNNTHSTALATICDQHTHKLTVGDKTMLELLDWQDLVNLSLVKKSWNKEISTLISYRNYTVEKFIDLRLFTNLQRCLAPIFKADSFVNKAVEIARSFYETRPRALHVVTYGVAFPMTPELLYYAMFLAKDEVVLEIAGANGENAALLAFSGAKRVYMNDIIPEEVQFFKTLCKQLPAPVQEKIKPVLGNCFDLLKLRPELKGLVGLVLCNNLLHFFNDKEQEEFFKLLKTILRPGGRAIFTANACYASPECKETFERYPAHTAWQTAQCHAQDYLAGLRTGTAINTIYRSVSLSTPSKVSLDYQQYYLWLKKNTTNDKWVEDKSGYKVLPPVEAEKLKQILDKTLKYIQTFDAGSVRLVTSVGHFFREESFAALFKKAGFEVEQTFLIQEDGHLYFDKNPYDSVTKVGIIIKAPAKGMRDPAEGKHDRESVT